jgi:PIN domain nuclease of toxin-antitoxin system
VRLLLDTHVWLWSLLAAQNLSRRAARALEDARNEIWLSPISVWELGLLVERGRVELETGVEPWAAEALRRAPLREAPLTFEVALAAASVALAHRDPADRLLLATARVFELTLLTADERLLGAKGIRTLAAR